MSIRGENSRETCRLIEIGFKYVCNFEGVRLFRKHK